MKSKSWNSKLLIIPTVLLILFLLFIPNNTTTIKTVYHTKTDTIHDTLTFVKDKPQIKVTETLKIDKVTNSKGDTIKLITEEKKYLDTLLCDKDTAIFEASVSRINAELESVKIGTRGFNSYRRVYENGKLIERNFIATTWYIG